jgi:hypothetical protein
MAIFSVDGTEGLIEEHVTVLDDETSVEGSFLDWLRGQAQRRTIDESTSCWRWSQINRR